MKHITVRGDKRLDLHIRNFPCLRLWFPDVPILALTGTATNLVAKDINQKLLLKTPYIVRTSADRVNLSYFVERKTSSDIGYM